MSVGKSSFLNSFVFFLRLDPLRRNAVIPVLKLLIFFIRQSWLIFRYPIRQLLDGHPMLLRSLFAVCLKGSRLIFV